MGNFTVKPENLTAAADNLENDISPDYTTSASNLRDAEVDAPGFGIALSWFDAMYRSRLDFMALDLDGASDVTKDIATALRQTAAQYLAAEDLNIAGFGGPGREAEGFGSSFGDALGNTIPGTVAVSSAAAVVGLAAIYGTSATLGACAGLCPAFIPAAIAFPLFIANIPSIFEAAETLKTEATNIRDTINAGLTTTLAHAALGWEGAGALGFKELSAEITAHLNSLAGFIDAAADVLMSVGITLTTLWVSLGIFAVLFLAWLIYMTGISIGPQAPVVQGIINSVGMAATSSWVTALFAVTGAVGAISIILGVVNQQLIKFLNAPDTGQSGVPDMQEFRVDPNFES